MSLARCEFLVDLSAGSRVACGHDAEVLNADGPRCRDHAQVLECSHCGRLTIQVQQCSACDRDVETKGATR